MSFFLEFSSIIQIGLAPKIRSLNLWEKGDKRDMKTNTQYFLNNTKLNNYN